ncbi:energy transducer TonB [Salinisphaera sp. SPP-AMP-43]|uniref:energy transducer TonB n=1 Tax=Salinisphaera sp. SPP-AMP-43 TaxID=3121288 RepID=UPI003C6E9E86
MTWQRRGESIQADLPADPLAEGLAQVFRSHHPVVLTGLTSGAQPVKFTVGQGPYEPVASDFLAHCPPTHERMPTLVRIRHATLQPRPDSVASAESYSLEDRPPPRYPAEAIQARHTGVVRLLAAITPEGDVLWPVIVQSSGYRELDDAALAAVGQWHFSAQPLGPNELYLLRQKLEFSVP